MNSLKKDFTYQHTIYACFIGYIVQAIVNNFVPLLFVTFQNSYGIPISQITFLVTFNFGLQLIIDLISPIFIDRIGYKASVMIAHIFASLGILLLTILPTILDTPFIGLLISVMVYAIGGGLIEVLISPIVEACPTDNKESAMSLLHSFYCWGHVGVVLISTIFFTLFGISNWRYLAILWAIVPFFNTIFFMKVPIAPLIKEDETPQSLKDLCCNRMFWIILLLMVCAGASEQAISQWTSIFAEEGLKVSKTIGDLTGTMFFAILMGTSRAIYGKFGEKINLEKFMFLSGILCVISYLIISLSPYKFMGLLGCGLCGLSVGIMWPGTFSIATSKIKNGGTLMFALCALAGDLGCSGGPTFVGLISSKFNDSLNMGILISVIFPILMLVGLIFIKISNKKILNN